MYLESMTTITYLRLLIYAKINLNTLKMKSGCVMVNTLLNLQLRALDKTDNIYLDRDTALSESTWKASLLSCGAVIEAVDAVMKGEAKNAFCAVRPPGHHAGVFG